LELQPQAASIAPKISLPTLVVSAALHGGPQRHKPPTHTQGVALHLSRCFFGVYSFKTICFVSLRGLGSHHEKQRPRPRVLCRAYVAPQATNLGSAVQCEKAQMSRRGPSQAAARCSNSFLRSAQAHHRILTTPRITRVGASRRVKGILRSLFEARFGGVGVLWG